MQPAQYVDPDVGMGESDISNEEDDFRFWKYSGFAIPCLLLILAIFTTLLCLTMWQSHSDIRELKDGTPRNLEPESDFTDPEGGIKKYKRNLRITVAVLAILFSLVAFLVYAIPMAPRGRAGINYILGVLLILTSFLALVAFAFDVNSSRDAERCDTTSYNPGYSAENCLSREDIATVFPIFDALLAVLAMTSACVMLAYSKSGDWNKAMDMDDMDGYGVGPAGYNLAPIGGMNSRAYVRKWLVGLALFCCLAAAIILLVFTILIHEDRRRIIQRDAFGRAAVSGSNEFNSSLPGWPRRNTAMRYTVCALVIITVLFNLIPMNNRVLAYVLGFLYFCFTALTFAAFGLDVNSIIDARDLDCPDAYDCVYTPYNATIALEFIGAIILLGYTVSEYGVCPLLYKRKKAQDI